MLITAGLLAWAGAADLTLADAVATGDCTRALQLLPATDVRTAGQRVAGAWCALQLDDPAAALALLEGHAEPLQGYAGWLRGRASFELGRHADAAAALADLQLPPEPARQAELLRARARIAAGDSKGEAALRRHLDGDLGPEARFWLGEAAGVRGEVDTLVRELTTVWTDGRPGGWDLRAAERLDGLGRLPDATTPEGEAASRARLASLQKHARNPEALELALVLQARSPPTTPSQWLALGDAHWRARSYDGALAAWGEVLGPPAEAVSKSADRLFDYALCHARAGDYDTAGVVYRRVFAQHPSHKKADFASYKLGYMEFDRRDCGRALSEFEAHLARFPSSRYLDDALWFSARCQWKAGDHDAATTTLARLAAARPKSSLAPGAAYWTARARGLQGDVDGEREALRALLKTWPTSGYAWFAAARLHTRFAPKPDAEPPAWPAAMAALGGVTRAEALLEVGLRPWARAELARVKPTGGRQGSLALAWARIRAGDYLGGKKLACPLSEPAWKAGDAVAQQACTPRPERGVVDAVRAGSRLDPNLPYAVMLAESNLMPEVASLAGARGLMQLMPELGATLHPRMWPERAYDPDDLYAAPYNVALGTLELVDRTRSLADVLDGTSAPAVVASYNGGEEAVRRWLEPFDTPPPFDEWSEDIGYTETRRYVQRVLGFSMAYRWVYGDPETGP